MILMQKNIQEIMLFRILPKPDQLIENIMIMVVKNHLTPERSIEQQRIHRDTSCPDCITEYKILRQKHPRQCNKKHGKQENISIEIHPPPKSVTETMKQRLSLSGKTRIGTKTPNKNSTKNRTPKRSQPENMKILLQSCEKC